MIFISHFLDDILKISDAITIFRNGRKVETTEVTPAIDKGWIIERMIGAGREELEESYLGEIKLSSRPEAPVALRATALTLSPSYRDVTFEARAGEVLGIYGFMGCGQLELARTLFGQASRRQRLARDRRRNEDAAEHRGRQTGRRRLCRGEPPLDAVRRRAGVQEHLDRDPRAPVALAAQARAGARNRRRAGQGARHPPAQDRIAPRRRSPAATSRRSRWRSG